MMEKHDEETARDMNSREGKDCSDEREDRVHLPGCTGNLKTKARYGESIIL
jgi:hypothetical protein